MTSLVAAAFANDPAWTFFFGDEYHQLAEVFAGALFDGRVGSGHVWVSQELTAVAMWDPPDGATLSTLEMEELWNPVLTRAGPAASQRMSDYGQALGAVRPSTPYWYLGVLATQPDRQGQGLATAVMAPVVGDADRDGLDCCLETSTVPNRLFYERRGFTDSTLVEIPAGPPTWWLRRAPSGSWTEARHRGIAPTR